MNSFILLDFESSELLEMLEFFQLISNKNYLINVSLVAFQILLRRNDITVMISNSNLSFWKSRTHKNIMEL